MIAAKRLCIFLLYARLLIHVCETAAKLSSPSDNKKQRGESECRACSVQPASVVDDRARRIFAFVTSFHSLDSWTWFVARSADAKGTIAPRSFRCRAPYFSSFGRTFVGPWKAPRNNEGRRVTAITAPARRRSPPTPAAGIQPATPLSLLLLPALRGPCP